MVAGLRRAGKDGRLRALALLCGLGLALLGQSALGSTELGLGLCLYALGLPLAVWGTRAATAPADRTLPAESVAPRRRYRPVGLILIGAGVLAEVSLLLLQEAGMLRPAQTWPGYFAGWLVCMIGLAVADCQRPGRAQLAECWAGLRRRRWEWLALALILAFAAVTRIYDLENTPIGLWGDEGNDGFESVRVLNGELTTPFTSDWGANPAMHQWVNAFFFMLFGPNIVALRLVAAVVGLLMILLTYLLGRQLWGPRVALLAAFFMTVSRWHIHRSRFDSVVTQGIPFELLAFLFLFRALRTRRLTDFAWCGLCGGLGLYFYHGLRAVPIIIGIFVLCLAIPHPLQFVRRYALGCVAAVLAALFAFAPLGQYYLHHLESFTGRAEAVLIFNQKTHFQSQYPKVEPTPVNMVLVQARDTALMFNYRGDPNEVFNWRRLPMLDPLMGVFFVLGLAYALWRWRDRRNGFVLIWFAVTMTLGSVLTVGIPHSVRTTGAIPAIMLLAAAGAARAWAALWPALRRAGRVLLVAGAAIWLGLMVYQNLDTYFNQFMPSRSVWYTHGGITTTVSRELRPYAEDYRLMFFWQHLAHRYHNVVRFIVGEMDAQDFGSLAEAVPVHGAADKGVIYQFMEDDHELAAYLPRWYPGGVLTTAADPWGKVVAASYRVEAAEIAAHQGLVGRYYAGADWAGAPILERTDKAVDFAGAWTAPDGANLAPTRDPFSVEWLGTLFGDGDQRYLGVVADGYASLELDGQEIVAGAGGGAMPVALARGLHSIRLRVSFPQGPAPARLVWGHAMGRLMPVETEALGTWPAAYGLLGAYYPNLTLSSPPAYYQVDPLMDFRWPRATDPLGAPFSAAWRGELQIDVAGVYTFTTQSAERSYLYIDDRLVVDNDGSKEDGFRAASVSLAAGSHAIRLQSSYQAGRRILRVYWTPPGGKREILPMEHLKPAGLKPADMPAISVGSADIPGGVHPAPWQMVDVWGGSGSGLGQLRSPLKAALLPDGRLAVADRGNRRVALFDAQGRGVASWGQPDLVEPTDVKIAPSGDIYVLDSGRGTVEVFDAAGKHLRSMGKDWGMYAPRSIALGQDGTLYVIATGSNQLFIVPPDGAPVKRIGTQGKGPGQFIQPVDLALDGAGNVYVLDTMANKRVQLFDAGGELLGEWPLEWAPNSGAPGFAYDAADDTLYLTDANNGRLLRYALDGAPLDKWTAQQLGIKGDFHPTSVTADSAGGRLYVVDGARQQIIVLSKVD
jgi:DNA-binding beta-propeller fold protein YncE/4-amino-4-deoxy-L-arabinose transferase-like glycosyltransferase